MRVLIVDDHPVYRRTVRTGLGDYPADVEVVGEATDGEEAIRLTKELLPDVILLDIKMRGMDGLTVLPLLHAQHPACGIILLTSHNERDLVLKGIRAGAVGYVLKEFGGEELVRAITAAYHHQSYFSPPVATTVREELVSGTASTAPQLTIQEVEILRGVSKAQRYRDIGKQLNLSEGTVSQYMQKIMDKLGAENRARAVAMAKDQGLI